ncbi:hypothetical protein [Paenibacillus andongensis]|uniref:hypothetical protein n=1 Tax=Paenibacillus andongensis TaxID=2975482 RepID=UPI0021BB3B99|nr:hypothetical protein [Paenibacillus andongensis]
MNKILNFSLITEQINNFIWSNCSKINEFRYFITQNKYYEDISVIEITFEYTGLDTYLIKTQFKELGSYEISSGGLILQLSLFQVTDIRDDGWSELNYKACDYESENIELFCKEIEVISLEKL